MVPYRHEALIGGNGGVGDGMARNGVGVVKGGLGAPRSCHGEGGGSGEDCELGDVLRDLEIRAGYRGTWSHNVPFVNGR